MKNVFKHWYQPRISHSVDYLFCVIVIQPATKSRSGKDPTCGYDHSSSNLLKSCRLVWDDCLTFWEREPSWKTGQMGNFGKNKRGEDENSRDNSCKEGKKQMVWNGETQKTEGGRGRERSSINKRCFFSLSGVTNDCTAQTCCYCCWQPSTQTATKAARERGGQKNETDRRKIRTTKDKNRWMRKQKGAIRKRGGTKIWMKMK